MIVLDSDVLIGLLRKEPRATAWTRALLDEGEELATTSVNAAEILRGARRTERDLETAFRILEGLDLVPFGPRAARRFGRLMHALDKAGARLPFEDGLIAAATMEAGARLATMNRRRFDRVAGLELVPL